VDGPYISYEKNPILTQRQLNPERKNPITTTGHADFVETPGGKWYAVFLGCRPYEGDFYNTGRETFMAPVEWKDGWPIILEGNDEVQYHYPVPMAQQTKEVNNNFSGNLYYKDDFKSKTLNPRFVFLRDPEDNLYSLSSKKGFFTLPLKPQTVSGKENPAFIGFRQQNLKGYASTSMLFKAASENEKAGLLIFQNETHYYFLCKSIENNNPMIQLYKSAIKTNEAPELLVSQILNSNKELQLKIEAKENNYAFYYAEKKNNWVLLMDNVDGKFLSTKVAGGFVGSMYGLYATSSGKQSSSLALFNWFEYKGNDEVYK
jgi:xylan 1,4-beta-xylosidase